MFYKKTTEIPLDLIVRNPEQPRKIFKEEEIMELSSSIKEYGVLQPVILQKIEGGKYGLVAGERRVRAAERAGLTKIPAIVKEIDDNSAAVIAIVENVQRENLTYIEEAYAYQKLIEEFGFTQCQLAEKIGKKQSTVSNKLRIIGLPMEIQKKLTENDLSERHGRALLKLKDDKSRIYILDRVIANNLNVKQTEKLIHDFLKKQEEGDKRERIKGHINYKIYLNTIRNVFKQIKENENQAMISEADLGEYMEVRITIPKDMGCFT